MISTRTAATLFLIVLNMQLIVSGSSGGTQGPSSSGESTPLVKKRRPIPKTVEMLVDATNDVSPVKAQGGGTEETSTSQELSIPQVDNQFEELIDQRDCGKISELGEKINNEELLKQPCPVIGTPDEYSEIFGYLKNKLESSFYYIFGNIEVVRRAIVASRVYIDDCYVEDGDLEIALPLALENDNHDRVIELLDIRKGITTEKDDQLKRAGKSTSFGTFVYRLLYHLAPWEDGTSLRRFLILRKDELRSRHHDTLDTLCQYLVRNLRDKLHLPKAERLLVDLIGQPSLLMPLVFAERFLYHAGDEFRSAFIKYGWRETIQEGLKSGHTYGGKKLWLVMQREKPDQFRGKFPITEEARAAVCGYLPTKQQKEDEWIKKYFTMLFDQLKNLDFLPDVLWSIISEYAVLFIAAMDLTFST